MQTTTKRPSLVSLYTRVAMAADERFSAALKAAGQDRWTTPHREWGDEVRAAYDAKVIADEHMHQAWQLWRS
jgi:hypothetical protein